MRRDANAITAEDGEGTTHIPSATIGVLSLGSCAPTGAAEGACAAAHPHVRGALYGHWTNLVDPTGPSPRAWGSLCPPLMRGNGLRSIPTCVGLSRRKPGHP
ncbi:hypothetical protein Tfu_1595 [Thermobifida fusca YX]|nr:hypothetical protein Tfu_1595 [Thermobifida fusca YX]